MPCIELGNVILHNPVPEPSDICQFVTKLAIEEMAILPMSNLEHIHFKPSAGIVQMKFAAESQRPALSIWIGKSRAGKILFNTMFCIWATHPPKMLKRMKKVSPSDCQLNTFWDHLDFWGQLRLRTLCNCSKWIYPATQASPQCFLGPKMHNLLIFFPNRGEGSFLEKFQIISFTSGPFTNLRMHACQMSIYICIYICKFICSFFERTSFIFRGYIKLRKWRYLFVFRLPSLHLS